MESHCALPPQCELKQPNLLHRASPGKQQHRGTLQKFNADETGRVPLRLPALGCGDPAEQHWLQHLDNGERPLHLRKGGGATLRISGAGNAGVLRQFQCRTPARRKS